MVTSAPILRKGLVTGRTQNHISMPSRMRWIHSTIFDNEAFTWLRSMPAPVGLIGHRTVLIKQMQSRNVSSYRRGGSFRRSTVTNRCFFTIWSSCVCRGIHSSLAGYFRLSSGTSRTIAVGHFCKPEIMQFGDSHKTNEWTVESYNCWKVPCIAAISKWRIFDPSPRLQNPLRSTGNTSQRFFYSSKYTCRTMLW